MYSETKLNTALNKLLQSRNQGANALYGFQYQILYSLYRTFELVDENTFVASVRFEGIEDVDLLGFNLDETYVQVKTSKDKQGWGWLNKEKILNKFIEVYCLNSASKFQLVTNFDFTGDLNSLYKYLNSELESLPQTIENKLLEIARNSNCPEFQASDFLSKLVIQKLNKPDLEQLVQAELVKHFEISTGNEDLYFLALIAKIFDAASQRNELTSASLRAIQFEIEDWISRGIVNPAIENGWIGRLSYQLEDEVLDYYLGVGARPAHILANLDAERPEWLEQINEALSEYKVVAIRASSGQGKSTLLYRFAFAHYEQHATYVLRNLQSSAQVEPVERYLKSRVQLGIPILVLIDDLNAYTHHWHELASRLAGYPISFLIASREENWFRFAGNLQNLKWASIFPKLSLQEAKDVFAHFQSNNRIAAGVKSAEWAYEQVSDKKLLIEFVFLVTQGQMLSERLAEQVKAIHFYHEDPAKLTILRLVSLAQILGVRLTLNSLISTIDFKSDPEMVINSLVGEYIELSSDRYLDGLHYVRSEHLVQLLHRIIPIETTVEFLIERITIDELPILALNIWSLPDLSDTTRLVEKLVNQTAHNTLGVLEVTRSLFQADEHRYLAENRQFVDTFVNEFGTPSLPTFFANRNMPFQISYNIFQEINKNTEIIEVAKLERMQALIQMMPERDNTSLLSKLFLGLAILRLSTSDLIKNLSITSKLAIWTDYFDLPFQSLVTYLETECNISEILSHSVEEIGDFLYMLWKQNVEKYVSVVLIHNSQIRFAFKMLTKTLLLEERENREIYIEFTVEESQPAHPQAVKRIELLRNFYPNFERYSCQGLYPLSPIDRLEIDETKKSILQENLPDKTPAELNALYIRELEALYSTKLMYDWMEIWQEWRITVVTFFKEVISLFEKQANGKSFAGKRLGKLWWDIAFVLNNPPQLPQKYESYFGDRAKLIRNWHSSTSNVLNFTLQVIRLADASEDSIRLFALNLRNAIGALDDMQETFSLITKSELNFYPKTVSSKEESHTYQYLLDLFDYLTNAKLDYLRIRRVSAKTVVASWIEGKQQDLLKQLNTAFREVFQEGYMVYLPNNYLYEPPQENLCFAIEVKSVNPLLEKIFPIFYGASQLQLDYDFVYAIPVIQQKRVYDYCFKASQDTIKAILNGTIKQSKISIFPVVIPPHSTELITEIREGSLQEGKILFEIQKLFTRLDGLRNEVYFVHSRLDSTELEFRTLMLQEIKEKVEACLGDAEDCLLQLQAFKPVHSVDNWSNLIEYFQTAFEERKEAVFDVEDYVAIPLSDDEELLALFDEYLSAEYFV